MKADCIECHFWTAYHWELCTQDWTYFECWTMYRKWWEFLIDRLQSGLLETPFMTHLFKTINKALQAFSSLIRSQSTLLPMQMIFFQFSSTPNAFNIVLTNSQVLSHSGSRASPQKWLRVVLSSTTDRSEELFFYMLPAITRSSRHCNGSSLSKTCTSSRPALAQKFRVRCFAKPQSSNHHHHHHHHQVSSIHSSSQTPRHIFLTKSRRALESKISHPRYPQHIIQEHHFENFVAYLDKG